MMTPAHVRRQHAWCRTSESACVEWRPGVCHAQQFLSNRPASGRLMACRRCNLAMLLLTDMHAIAGCVLDRLCASLHDPSEM